MSQGSVLRWVVEHVAPEYSLLVDDPGVESKIAAVPDSGAAMSNGGSLTQLGVPAAQEFHPLDEAVQCEVASLKEGAATDDEDVTECT